MSNAAWLSIEFVTVTALLLAVAVRARMALGWRLLLSVGAAIAYFVHLGALEDLAGRPRPGPLPAEFEVLGTRIVEPRPGSADTGFIELWIRPRAGIDSRLYRLPYETGLAERVAAAGDRLGEGRPQVGRRGNDGSPAAAQVSFGDRPPPRLPPKQ